LRAEGGEDLVAQDSSETNRLSRIDALLSEMNMDDEQKLALESDDFADSDDGSEESDGDGGEDSGEDSGEEADVGEGKNFQRHLEDFKCGHCGYLVEGRHGYENHCTQCLWSKHVDINPGDRAASCRGLMPPVQLDDKRGQYRYLQRCEDCGHERWNKQQEGDDFEAILRISSVRDKGRGSNGRGGGGGKGGRGRGGQRGGRGRGGGRGKDRRR